MTFHTPEKTREGIYFGVPVRRSTPSPWVVPLGDVVTDTATVITKNPGVPTWVSVSGRRSQDRVRHTTTVEGDGPRRDPR